MKRFSWILLSLLLLFLFAACGETPANIDKTTEEETLPAKTYPETLKAPADLRQTVLDYMYSMSQVKWIARNDMHFTSKNLEYTAGETYVGLPYNVWIVGTKEGYERYIDENGVYMGPDEWSTAPGVHCSSAVRSSWLTVANSSTFSLTVNMLPASGTGILPVGEYDWSDAKSDTSLITAKNPPEVMYAAYAQLQKGDAIVTAWSTTGHARMAVKQPVPVLDADGKIDGDKTKLTVIEQTSSFSTAVDYNTTWRVNREIKFKKLYEDNYIPVTVEELVQNKAEDATFTITGAASPAKITEVTMLKGLVKSNYRMISVTAEITDENGNVVLGGTGYPYDTEYVLTEMGADFKVASLPAGRYRYQVRALVGFGEAILLDYTFTK